MPQADNAASLRERLAPVTLYGAPLRKEPVMATKTTTPTMIAAEQAADVAKADGQERVAARVAELEAALERLRPILQNSKDSFQDPALWEPSAARGYRLEGLASGCRIGLEVIDKALAKEVACPDCWKGKAIPCAVNCRDSDECCDKRLGYPCERCGGSGVLRVAA